MDPLALAQTKSDLDFLDEAALSAMTAIVATADVQTPNNDIVSLDGEDYGQWVAKVSFLVATGMLEQRDKVRALYRQALQDQAE